MAPIFSGPTAITKVSNAGGPPPVKPPAPTFLSVVPNPDVVSDLVSITPPDTSSIPTGLTLKQYRIAAEPDPGDGSFPDLGAIDPSTLAALPLEGGSVSLGKGDFVVVAFAEYDDGK